MKRLLLAISILALTGCGSGGGTGLSGGQTSARTAPPAPPSMRILEAASPTPLPSPFLGPLFTIKLRPGWNPVAFQCSQLVHLRIPPGIAGFAFFSEHGYLTRPLTLDTCNNEDEGARRGLWVFATEACELTYGGHDDGRGQYNKLRPGWNLVSFTTTDVLSGRVLQAFRPNGDLVDFGSNILTQFYKIRLDDNHNVLVDVFAGDEIEPGCPYWIYAARPVYLVWGEKPPLPDPSPVASPAASPGPSPTVSPSPSPTASPGPSPTASPSPSPTPSPASSPSPSPAASPSASPSPSAGPSPATSPSPSP